MGATTGIAYARSTRNIWSGCTKIGPGCDGCYAEGSSRRMRGLDPETGEAANWGPGRPRVYHGPNAEKDIRKWNDQCRIERGGGKRVRAPREQRGNAGKGGKVLKRCFTEGWTRPGFWPVFINTFSDTFDNEVPEEWRWLLWTLIEECEYLDFYLVTKRIGNVAGMVPARWMREGFPPNVRVLVTICNQKEADRDLPQLLALPCKNGVSYEPALGPVDFAPEFGNHEAWDYLRGQHKYGELGDEAGVGAGVEVEQTRRLEWLIPGGESDQAGHKARPFHLSYARSTVRQARAAGVPVFVKQLGSHVAWDGTQSPEEHWPDWKVPPHEDTGNGYWRVHLKDRAGADPAEWPSDLRVQEWPQ